MATLALLLAPLLALLSSSPEPAPAALHGGRAAPHAWLAVHRGALWICWDDGLRRGAADPGCWQRIDLPLEVDPREVRGMFLDAATALIRGPDARTLQISRGDAAALPTETTVEPRGRPAPLACSPIGHVPIFTRGRWGWRDAPCPADGGQCVAPPLLPRLRRPGGPALTLGLEVRVRERRGVDGGAQSIAGTEFIASLGATFDPAAWFGHRVAWQDLQAARRPRVLELPAPRSTGPLAARERDALAAAVCGGPVR